MKCFATIAVLSFLVAACTSVSSTPASTTAPTSATGPSPSASVPTASVPSLPVPSPSVPSLPVGLIAIGHSGLTGEGTGGPSQSAPENSWATGSSADVDSVYLRLQAARPDTADHVANAAQGGAVAASLADQAEQALQDVPTPALVIISTIDNDIRCDGTDDAHIPEFGADVAKALDTITMSSPDSRILIVGQLGRPRAAFIKQLVAYDPTVKPFVTGTGMCDFYDPSGKLDEPHLQALTAIIDRYEAEEARVCSKVPQCHTDGGVRAAYVDKLENFSADWAHLNVRGQAAEAALIWPVVVSILGL
jgi:hypothetical protein